MPDLLLRTKFHLPSTRPNLVSRPRLQEQIRPGIRGPLTLVIAPAGFGKTTLVASYMAACGMPVAWLSLDKNDNEPGRFLNYVLAAVQEADNAIGREAAQLMASSMPPLQLILTSLINDLDLARREIILVLDDYQFINSQAVHEQVTFLLEHCPRALHLVIVTRSDPPLPLTRLRARGQTTELRAADLRFTEPEAAQFLNDIMGLRLDPGSVALLEERTEGWIAGLQMAALSMRDREDVPGFIKGFSGTNRYILDYLVEEVLASQSPEIQRFLLYTSILDRLTAPLCDAVLAHNANAKSEGNDRSPRSNSSLLQPSASILEYLDRENLFLVPLDEERTWYRYHHLFADLLRTQLHRSLGAQGVAQLHICASEWLGRNGSVLEAIQHASMASDDERVERFIEQNYAELVRHGEQSGLRFWTGKLSRELVYRRPWLCIYEAYSHSWFGELDEADLLLEAAERRIRSEDSIPDAPSMLAHVSYIRSRVTAMRGNLDRAIQLCRAADEYVPAGNLALQLDILITLGYEYFQKGDYANASQILTETIRSGRAAGAIINTVGSYCILARLYAVQGLLNQSYEAYRIAAEFLSDSGGQHLGASALVEVGIADVLCEWNELDAALAHINQGLSLLAFWGKTDDLALAQITLARMHLARSNRSAATEAIEKANHLIQRSGVFPEARHAVELARVKLSWLAQGNIQAASRWFASLGERFGSGDAFSFENEVTHLARARVLIAQNKPEEAIDLLSRVEETARSAGRMGRVIEILLLRALALRQRGDSEPAIRRLNKCLALAEPEGYVRIFLDEGGPMRMLLAQWLAHAENNRLRDYVIRLLSQFETEPPDMSTTQENVFPAGGPSASWSKVLVEPLTQRELEVLHLLALGRTNQEIAGQLFVSRGTIKAHTASIYRKLDVANRTEAVARARHLGILP